MKGTGKVCIRILCAIFVGVVLGCSGASGESGDGGNGGGGTPCADICGLVHENLQHPAYMNITADFGGQRFVESNADWFDDSQNDKNTKFTEHYNDADKYIDCKVAELQKLWQKENTGSDLSNKIGTALNSFNNGTSINQKIDNNYNALAPVFVTMEKLNDLNSDTGIKDYYTYKASYHKLAANAYIQSLGQYVNNTSDFPSITELQGATFNYELKKIDPSYTNDTFTTEVAKVKMEQSLNTIAQKTDTNSELLKKVVELAMVNESLYGLNDYANRVKINVTGLKSTQRSLSYFENIIKSRQSYSIDDRTM